MERERGRSVSPELMLKMFATGKKRAISGKVVPISQLREISDKHERVKEYLSGYMSVVEGRLSEMGIDSPSQLGIHESFMHIIVQDDDVKGTSGVEGLVDGTRLVKFNQDHERLDKSAWNHYRDGYTIGLKFESSNLRVGNFEALAHEADIERRHLPMIDDEIGKWLSGNRLTSVRPDVLIHLHPYARLGFSYCINSGGEGPEDYLQQIAHRHDTNPSIQGLKAAHLEAVRRGFDFARKIKSS